MNIIPAIDILDRKIVRLRQGDYNQATVYNTSLEEMIQQFDSNGTNFVHIIDLNGAKGDDSNQAYIVNAIRNSDLHVQYGGGVRSIDKVKELIDLGFRRVIVGTQALTDPPFLENLSKEICGKDQCSDAVVIAIDVLDEVIKYSGWMESSPHKLLEYIGRCTSLGYFRFLCTDIGRDGKLEGASNDLYSKILDQYPFIRLIGSGGISSMEDIRRLNEVVKLESVVVGKALYEGKISTEEVKDWNLFSLVSL